MIAYFDTSAIVPLLVQEDGSERAKRVWDEAERVVGVRLVYAEGHAALAMAHRVGRISPAALRDAVRQLATLYEQMEMVEVTGTLVRRAGVLAESYGLRGYDAVHLAGAETLTMEDVVLVAGDTILCQAASLLGLAVAGV